MEYKLTIESLDKMLNGLIESDGKLTESQQEEIQQVERYRTELTYRVAKIKDKLEAIRETDANWWSGKRKTEFTKDELNYNLKTAIRMAYCYAMPLLESEFKDNFYGSMGDLGKHFTATEEQLLVAPSLAFGEHYKYLYTFINK